MSVSRSRLTLMMITSTLLLGGCGSGIGGCDGNSNNNGNNNGQQINFNASEDAKEAPQYEATTMANLQGKEQPFPSKYPLPNYPNSRVTMAWVRPNLRPGEKNIVMLDTSDVKTTVDTYYRTWLVQQGYKIQKQFETPAYCWMIWTKPTDHGVQEVEVRVSPNPKGKETVQLWSGPYREVTNDWRKNPPPF